jgi:hypothetical protein
MQEGLRGLVLTFVNVDSFSVSLTEKVRITY